MADLVEAARRSLDGLQVDRRARAELADERLDRPFADGQEGEVDEA